MRDVPGLVPADVGNAVEHLLQELAYVGAADHARAPWILAERRLEDHVVRHHRENSVDVVGVPHAIEAIHEGVAVECHGVPPQRSMPSRATTISPLKCARAASIHICSVTAGSSAGTRCESTSVLTPAAAATRPASSADV